MGPLLFGGFQLVRGVLYYLTVPSGARKATHFATLCGLIAVGILSAGFVGVSEAQAAQETAAGKKWKALIDETSLDVTKASDLVTSVADRPGPFADERVRGARQKDGRPRLDEEAALSDRFEAQEKTAP
jgi:hypothetical protein